MDALAGIWLVLRTPRLWPLCVGPLLGALTAYVLLGVGIGFWAVPRLAGWLRLDPNRLPLWALEIGFVVLWVVLFSFLFTRLASVFAGLIFEPLAREVERTLDGGRLGDAVPVSRRQALADSLARFALNAALAVGALALSLFLGPVPGVLVAALVGLLDYTSPAYLRRGHTLGAQWGRLRRRLDTRTLGIALVAGVASLVPFAGVLAIPGLIAGGTLLVRAKEDTLRS